jgi:LAGLIDADG DNA endonuclease family
MGDGYFSEGNVKICTDNFTKKEVLNLIKVLDKKFGIKATSNKRNNPNNKVV